MTQKWVKSLLDSCRVNRVLLCRLQGMPLANLFRLEQRYGCCNVVQNEKGSNRVESINILPEMLSVVSCT